MRWVSRLDRGFLTKNGQAGTENPWTFQPATRTRDRSKRGQGFLLFPIGVIGEGNPCPYVFISFPQIRTMSYRQRKRRKWRSALFGGPTPESPRGPSQLVGVRIARSTGKHGQ